MSDQTITGDRLWNEILKAIVYTMPGQLFPLIKEVYGKEYPPDTSIRLLNTEHSTCLDDPKNSPSSKLMDISLLVAGTDYYHIKCQMDNDRLMVVRMISYDLHYAIEHCISGNCTDDESTLRFPHSVVLYPDQNRNLPDSLKCRVIFQDNSEHLYRIPTVKIHSYSLREIHRKHLTLFIPYLLLRLKPRITSKRHRLPKKELTEFMDDIIVILQQDLTNGYLTKQECSDYINLLTRASEHIFYHHPTYHKEVQRMTKPLIILPSMEIAQLKASLAEKDSQYKTALAEKDSEIAELRARLAELTPS